MKFVLETRAYSYVYLLPKSYWVFFFCLNFSCKKNETCSHKIRDKSQNFISKLQTRFMLPRL